MLKLNLNKYKKYCTKFNCKFMAKKNELVYEFLKEQIFYL